MARWYLPPWKRAEEPAWRAFLLLTAIAILALVSAAAALFIFERSDSRTGASLIIAAVVGVALLPLQWWQWRTGKRFPWARR